MVWSFAKRRRRPRRAIQFYTRADCPLCDEALRVMRKYAKPYRLDIEIIDIAADADLEDRFGHQIPVVFIDGQKRFFGHVDPVLLLRILNRPAQDS